MVWKSIRFSLNSNRTFDEHLKADLKQSPVKDTNNFNDGFNFNRRKVGNQIF